MWNKFTAVVERSGRWYVAYSPEIPGANRVISAFPLTHRPGSEPEHGGRQEACGSTYGDP